MAEDINGEYIAKELGELFSLPNNDIQTRIELMKVYLLYCITSSLDNIDRYHN